MKNSKIILLLTIVLTTNNIFAQLDLNKSKLEIEKVDENADKGNNI